MDNPMSRLLALRPVQAAMRRADRILLRGMGIGVDGDYHASGELGALKYIAAQIGTRAAVVFDVGANVGGYTEEVLRVMPSAVVYAFEPVPETFRRLEENQRIAHAPVHRYNFGFSNVAGKSTIFYSPENNGLSSIYDRKYLKNKITSHQETIELRTIDAFCEAQHITDIDFLKIDTEGGELVCLQGAAALLKEKRIHFIQFEFGCANVDARTFFQDFWYLLKDSYRIYRILPGGLYEIRGYFDDLEVLRATNYLAERI